MRFLALKLVLLLSLFLSPAGVLGADPPVPQPKEEPEKAAPSEEEKETSEEPKDEDDEDEKQDRYLAIQGGVIHTVTDGDIFGSTILTKNGKIFRIAQFIDLPEDCEVLDASGYDIYPGLVAVTSGGLFGSEPPEDTSNVYAIQMTIALAGGITTAVTGNTAAKLTFGSTDDMVAKRDLFETLSYSTSDPESRRKTREGFEKVRQYIRDLEDYEQRKKADPEAKEPDGKWVTGDYAKYLKLLKGEAVAKFNASRASEIIEVCDLASRFGIRGVVVGAMEGWTVAPQIARAGLSAIVTPRTMVPSNDEYNRPTGSSIENAAILSRHGVRIAVIPGRAAVTLWGLAGRDILQLNMEAAFAVRGGLDQDSALRTITIDAARILGVDHRVGSIEIGKDADFAITDGDMLHYMTHVQWTVVNGSIVYDKVKERLYDHIRPDGNLDAPPPDDYWPRRLGADQ